MQKRWWATGLLIPGLLWFQRKRLTQSIINPSDLRGQCILVTGASTGIGFAVVKALAEAEVHVFATVRKTSDAERLSALSANITPLIMDVTKPEQITTAVENVREQLQEKTLNALINNAGIAVAGPLEHLPLEDLRWQFEVNVMGLVEVTQRFLPLLSETGKVINISSISGKTTQPFLGAYSASKHAVEALSDALRREFVMTGSQRDVIVIQPGKINTPIWDKAEQIDLAPYENTPYFELGQKIKALTLDEGRQGAPASKVADAVVRILLRKKNPSRYVVSQNWTEEIIVPRTLPPRWLDSVMKRFFK